MMPPIHQPNQRLRRLRTPIRWVTVLLASVLLSSCARITVGTTAYPDQYKDRGERKKSWTGTSFMESTRVDPTPGPSLTASGFDSERVWGGYDDWEPAVGVDPSGQWIYQLTTRYDGPATIAFRRSGDGGATWDVDQDLFPTGRPQADPMIEVAEDGAIYAVFLDNWDTSLTKSTDHGETWSPLVRVLDLENIPFEWTDRPVLAISRDGRDVYVAFNISDSYVAASHDYGETFGPPVKTNLDARYYYHSSGAVGPTGDIYFATADYSLTALYLGKVNISVISSRDGGLTWNTTRLDTSYRAPTCAWADGCAAGYLGPSVGLDVDSQGRILVAYHSGDRPGQPQKMYVRYSVNGQDWSGRTQISHDERRGNNGFPAVGAGPSPGDFRVVWQSDLDGTVDSWNTYFRQSTDGGQTWSEPLRLSDQPDGAPYKYPDGYNFPYGHYLEMGVDDAGVNHVIWGEAINYNGPGGCWYTRGE